MRGDRFARLLFPVLLTAFGCSGDKGSSGGDWKVGDERVQPVPSRAKGYGAIDGKKGDQVRATFNSTAEPVDVRLYLDNNGQETELGKKEKVKEGVLEATLSGDGKVMLQMTGAYGDTEVKYKMESRPGKK